MRCDRQLSDLEGARGQYKNDRYVQVLLKVVGRIYCLQNKRGNRANSEPEVFACQTGCRHPKNNIVVQDLPLFLRRYICSRVNVSSRPNRTRSNSNKRQHALTYWNEICTLGSGNMKEPYKHQAPQRLSPTTRAPTNDFNAVPPP